MAQTRKVMSLDELETEAVELYDDLKAHGDAIDPDASADAMSYFRTRTSLLEKILSVKERTLGLKQQQEFQATILRFIEESLTPDQRTKVMEALRKELEQQ